MTRLSVDINKVATLRNARGGQVPSVLQVALDIEHFGAHGITIHPRPDQRHITKQDVYDLAPAITTEFNIEGYPNTDFINMVCQVKPAQVTLVPDGPDVLTSNAGWDAVSNKALLQDVIGKFKEHGIRTSIFIETNEEQIRAAKTTGTDRIELYTEAYAAQFNQDKEAAVAPYVKSALVALEEGLGINAGHDLDLNNLSYFASQVPGLLEVSIGHALISDALYFGLENVVQMYNQQLKIAAIARGAMV